MLYGNFLIKGMGLPGSKGNGTGRRIPRFNAQVYTIYDLMILQSCLFRFLAKLGQDTES